MNDLIMTKEEDYLLLRHLTQKDKELLLQDLCARLPYGVKIKLGNYDYQVCGYDSAKKELPLRIWYYYKKNSKSYIDVYLEDYQPYLRSLSSMTEEESAELSNIISEWFDKELFYLTEEPFLEYALSKINYSISPLLFDWLNKNMFDYRGLIPKGLALEAPEGMYNIK